MSDEKPRDVEVQVGQYDFRKNLNIGRTKASFLVEQDTPFETILDMDEKGVFLRWSIVPEEFKQLADDEVKQLSAFAQTTYQSFLEAAVDEARIEKKNEIFAGLPKVFARRHTARDAQKKLNINKAIPGRKPGWKRPDEIAEREAQGWRRVAASDGYTPAFGTMSAGDGVVIKTKDGKDDDLVLMDIDEQLHNKILWDNDAYASGLVKSARERFESEAHDAGVPTFEEGSEVERRARETPRSVARRRALQSQGD